MTFEEIIAKAYWRDSHRAIFNKDCRRMSELPDDSVQCVVTSPPYWGLRRYAGEQDLIWSGKEDCEHEWGDQIISLANDSNRGTMEWKTGGNPAAKVNGCKVSQGNFCLKCGAWRGALGLEPTPELYVQHTIEILREIRRVLRKDGVVFWNIGDSYQGGNRGASIESDIKRGDQGGSFQPHNIGAKGIISPSRLSHPTIKPKDLCLIPFRVAIAAQEDGWWVRSVIIWSKPNPMPESVTDRPTESHEYILMLTKSAKYYWDAEAVREKYESEPDHNLRDKAIEKYIGTNLFSEGGRDYYSNGGRNLRSVWTFPTQSYKGAHFATYPEKLVEICVKAATPEVGCCSKCGKPWVRIIKPTKEYEKLLGTWTPDTDADPELRAKIGFAAHSKKVATTAQYETLGWKPQCSCNADKVPSIVLDPFVGSGTTLKVAAELNRRAVGYELSGEYCQLAVKRNKQAVIGFEG